MVASDNAVTGRNAPTSSVGEPLTDEAREDAIKRAGELMLRKYADFARTRNRDDLDAAYSALLLQNKLIDGRSRDAVLRQEIRKGLI